MTDSSSHDSRGSMKTTTALSSGKTLRYRAEAALFFAFMGFFRLLGLDAASAVGGFIGRHVFRRLPPAKTARDNLRAAYPAMSERERECIVGDVCENMGRVTAEYALLDKLVVGPGKRVEIEGVEHAEAAVASGKGVMFISAHLGNWEVMPFCARYLGYDGGIVYRPPNNPFVDRFIARQRATLGPAEQITKSAHGTRRIFTLLRRGKSIFMLVDQKTYEGVPIPFFGRAALTTTAPASLALKLGSVLLPVSCERTGGAHFRVHIRAPIGFEPSGKFDDDVVAVTSKINESFEAIVREHPSQWLWIHHRWITPRDIQKMKNQGLDVTGLDTSG